MGRDIRLISLIAVFLFCGVLVCEAVALGYLYLDANTSAQRRYLFFQRYAMTRMLMPLFSAPASTALDIVRETRDSYIGDMDNARPWGAFLSADSLLGWRVGRSITAIHHSKYVYVTNEQGFASIGKAHFSYQRTKPPNTCRVIVVGGSTVFGGGALTPNENLPAQINELFQLQHQKICSSTEVINAGVPSYTSSQELLYLMSELVNYNPDLIIEYGGWNDMEINNQSINERGDGSDFRTIVHDSLERRLRGSYTVRGSLMHLLGSIRGDIVLMLEQLGSYTILEQLATSAKQNFIGASVSRNKYHHASVEIYRRNLDHMIYLGRKAYALYSGNFFG